MSEYWNSALHRIDESIELILYGHDISFVVAFIYKLFYGRPICRPIVELVE